MQIGDTHAFVSSHGIALIIPQKQKHKTKQKTTPHSLYLASVLSKKTFRTFHQVACEGGGVLQELVPCHFRCTNHGRQRCGCPCCLPSTGSVASPLITMHVASFTSSLSRTCTTWLIRISCLKNNRCQLISQHARRIPKGFRRGKVADRISCQT